MAGVQFDTGQDIQRDAGPLSPTATLRLKTEGVTLIGAEIATFLAGSIPYGDAPRFVRREASPY